MRTTRYFLFLLLAGLLAACTNKPPEWKTGIQTYTFHAFTLMQTLDKTKELGLEYAEAFFFQELGAGFADTAYLNFDLPLSVRKQLKEEFAKRDIQLYSFGVASYDTEEDWNRFFAFAKDMGIHTVTCEPRLDQLDLVEKLALQYKIEVAIHNHPAPSVYADPDVLIKALEGRDAIMGVCADIGHWKRMGKDPVETLKKCKGRVKVVHLKDLNAQLEDTSWGTGILPVSEVLQELKAQHFDGLISVEYENYSDSQLDDITRSLTYYKQQL